MISKKGSTTVGATKGYGLAKGFGSNHNTLLGFFKAKLIRTPLNSNEQWNRRINKCRNTDDFQIIMNVDIIFGQNGSAMMIFNIKK